jgi:hypothetical protein
MTQEPKLAYFPDSFGASPALPSLLQAAGFTQAGITRIDGMDFLGFLRNAAGRYPRPGSSAELLLKQERTLDFVWRDRSGAEVLCHWNAFSYGQGDMLAHRGISRMTFIPLAIPDRSDRNVARRIRRFAEQLIPYSPTPYLFCPSGFDFVPPIPGLVGLLDRYNRNHYPETGIWAVNAGLDDYLDLVEQYRDRLPVIELDPNPYWTGFYTARPALKASCHELVEQLRLAESLALLPENTERLMSLDGHLPRIWQTAALSNHHDFITGTSSDPVVYGEQRPWLDRASRRAAAAVRWLSMDTNTAKHDPSRVDLPQWSRRETQLQIRTPHLYLEVDEAQGGIITRAEDPNSGESLLAGPSNDLIRYRVSGGLWRMGHEFSGGTWKESGRTSHQPVRVEVGRRGMGLELSWSNRFDGEPIHRWMWIDNHSPRIHFRLAGKAGRRRTVTAEFDTGLSAEQFTMDVPGGVATRGLEKVYSPTFWPFQHFAHVRDGADGRSLAILHRRPGAVSLGRDGRLQVVALRNATIERAYGLFPLFGNPAKGYEKEAYVFEYALEFTGHGAWSDNGLAASAYSLDQGPWAELRASQLAERTNEQVVLDREDVFLLADKPAQRGDGRIVRLYTLAAAGKPVQLRLKSRRIRAATVCDARERDLQTLSVTNGRLQFEMPGAFVSLRLQT